MSELLKHLKTIAILSIPAWGIFLPIITLRALPHSFADVIVKILDRFGFGYIIPISLIVYGYSPIYKAMWPAWIKALLGVFYFGFAVGAIFFFGLLGACVNTSCH